MIGVLPGEQKVRIKYYSSVYKVHKYIKVNASLLRRRAPPHAPAPRRASSDEGNANNTSMLHVDEHLPRSSGKKRKAQRVTLTLDEDGISIDDLDSDDEGLELAAHERARRMHKKPAAQKRNERQRDGSRKTDPKNVTATHVA
eukprot:scaffold20451_cov28-Tisochrysis_lutea.AAC.1